MYVYIYILNTYIYIYVTPDSLIRPAGFTFDRFAPSLHSIDRIISNKPVPAPPARCALLITLRRTKSNLSACIVIPRVIAVIGRSRMKNRGYLVFVACTSGCLASVWIVAGILYYIYSRCLEFWRNCTVIRVDRGSVFEEDKIWKLNINVDIFRRWPCWM